MIHMPQLNARRETPSILLPITFHYGRFSFRQLAREGDVILLEKFMPICASVSYEVVIVQKHRAKTIHGREFPERESMPRSESWGELGWTFPVFDSAQAKFRQLVTLRANADSLPTPFPPGPSQAKERLRCPGNVVEPTARIGIEGVAVPNNQV